MAMRSAPAKSFPGGIGYAARVPIRGTLRNGAEFRRRSGRLRHEARERFPVFVRRPARDLGRHFRRGGLAREADGVEPVANVLLVEALGTRAFAVRRHRPE